MIRRTGSIRLLQVFGIRVGVDRSWFVVLFIVIFALSAQFRHRVSASDAVAYLTAVAAALLFFASIVLHELGHALAARREGVETTSIDLWFFGGLARLSRDARTPGEEFRMAAAGPLVTLLVVALCVGLGLALVGWPRYRHAAAFDAGVDPGLLLLAWLATINLVLLLFNLVPAYPLDGGRIARAAVWRVTGDRGKGTRAAARLGQAFAYVLGGIGVLLVVDGALSGLYLVVLGFLFGSSSRGAMLQSAFTERLEAMRVTDLMDHEPVAVPSDLPVERAWEDYFLRYRWPWFPVVDSAGRFVGLLREHAAREGAGDPVAAVIEPAEPWRVEQDRTVDELVSSEPLRRLGALVVVDHEGRLRGVVTLDDVRRAVTAAALPGRG